MINVSNVSASGHASAIVTLPKANDFWLSIRSISKSIRCAFREHLRSVDSLLYQRLRLISSLINTYPPSSTRISYFLTFCSLFLQTACQTSIVVRRPPFLHCKSPRLLLCFVFRSYSKYESTSSTSGAHIRGSAGYESADLSLSESIRNPSPIRAHASKPPRSKNSFVLLKPLVPRQFKPKEKSNVLLLSPWTLGLPMIYGILPWLAPWNQALQTSFEYLALSHLPIP